MRIEQFIEPELQYYYHHLSTEERDKVILSVLKTLGDKVVSMGSLKKWEAGWDEVLERVRERGVSHSTLKPQYFRSGIMRLNGDYVKAANPDFEYDVFWNLKRALFKRYIGNQDQVVEFGCGTGANLLQLLVMFPEVSAVGCDWATSSQEILELISAQTPYNVRGVNFDMLTLKGREEVGSLAGKVVFTFHALEQLGSSFVRMIDYLHGEKPRVCVHVEPIVEFYDEDNLLASLAIRYHQKRDYLDGFLTMLKVNEKYGKVKILEANRLGFGSVYHEGYSVVVWKPI